MKPLLSIQYLRAFAALAVVLFHACQWADINFDIGAGGVDVFFVISGFLMWRIAGEAGITPLGFLGRRIGRVAPLYWIATLALVALAVTSPMLIWQLKPRPWHVLLSLFFVPHLDPDGIPFPFLPPGWTLNYEAILYLIFTGALLCPKPWRLRVVLGALCAIPIVGFFIVPLFPMFANPLMLEFVAGVLLARAAENGKTATLGSEHFPLRLDQSKGDKNARLLKAGALPRRQTGSTLAGSAPGWSLIALGLVCFAVLRLLGIHSDIGRWFLWGAPAVLIVSGALAVEARDGLPRIPALKRIGDASYSIYLCHWPIIAVASRLAGPERSWPFVALSALAAVLAGLMVHIVLEKPMLRWLQRRPTVAALSAG